MRVSIPSTWKRKAVWLILAGSLAGLFGCQYMPFGYTPIKDIIQNPAKYERKEVKIRGVVSQVTKIPFVEVNFYTLSEEGYQIVVVAKETVPALQDKLSVAGTVENVAIVGKESIGLHVKESHRAFLPF